MNDTETPFVGVLFCYKNCHNTYVPELVGMDYKWAKEYQLYRQLLFQTIKRANALQFPKIDFGVSASFEKRKLGRQNNSKSSLHSNKRQLRYGSDEYLAKRF